MSTPLAIYSLGTIITQDDLNDRKGAINRLENGGAYWMPCSDFTSQVFNVVDWVGGVDGFQDWSDPPETGRTVYFAPSVSGAAGSLSLSVNGDTAYEIRMNPSTALLGHEIVAGRVYRLTFDGSYWLIEGAVPVFMDAEVPTGDIDGVNTDFTFSTNPNPQASLQIFLNGSLQIAGTDYTWIATDAIQFGTAPSGGNTLIAWYRA